MLLGDISKHYETRDLLDKKRKVDSVPLVLIKMNLVIRNKVSEKF